ncbi:MAG: beta-glucosidase [Sulfobacillus thermosulfidooxidans]|nr:MAG: beta-glucosidase [Sulfobacillus thermosulfidooxidans]
MGRESCSTILRGPKAHNTKRRRIMMGDNSNMTYKDPTIPAHERARHLVSLMTLDEKVAQLTSVWVYEVMDGLQFDAQKARAAIGNGIGQITRVGGASNLEPLESAQMANAIQRYLTRETRLGIPAMIHEEACSGYMSLGATSFPQTIGLASTWDTASIRAMGEVIARQMRVVGAHQALAPLLDIARDARWGRVEETFGEDPYMVAQLGMAYIRGLQEGDHRVLATGKHFVGYGASEGGMNWAPAHVNERELRESFLWPFEAAVKEAHLGSIMPAYHEIDGIPCHASSRLLQTILRDEWQFDGLIVSDYFALAMLEDYHHLTDSRAGAAAIGLTAGVDIELPTRDCYGSPLVDAIRSGLCDVHVLDTAVERVLTHKFALGLFENPFVDEATVSSTFLMPGDLDVARKLARESMVLLKNDGGILPLSKTIKRVAILGPHATSQRNLMGDYSIHCHIDSLLEMRDQGTVFATPLPESLSVADVFRGVPSIVDAVREKLHIDPIVGATAQDDVLGLTDEDIVQAAALAKTAEVAIVTVGDKAGLTLECTSGESRDRTDLTLPGRQAELVRAIANTGTPVILVLLNGRPIALTDVEPYVAAIVDAWLPGSEGGQAIADVLFGDCNPSGKLPISFPRTVGQVPVFYNHKPSGGRSHWHGDYVDGPAAPLYPFGYGLSYTTFRYDNLAIAVNEEGGELTVSFTVTNTGSRSGAEVAQVYLHDVVASVTRPVKELKGFARVTLEPGETRRVQVKIPMSALAFYDASMQYRVEPGQFDVMVGSSSTDSRLEGSFRVANAPTTLAPVFHSVVEITKD